MAHCYNVFMFILFVSRTPNSLLAGSFWKVPCLSFTVVLLLGLFSFYLDQIPFAEVSV